MGGPLGFQRVQLFIKDRCLQFFNSVMVVDLPKGTIWSYLKIWLVDKSDWWWVFETWHVVDFVEMPKGNSLVDDEVLEWWSLWAPRDKGDSSDTELSALLG